MVNVIFKQNQHSLELLDLQNHQNALNVFRFILLSYKTDCYTCENAICLSYIKNYYNINNKCISRANLKLNYFLLNESYIYILSYETKNYFGVNINGSFEFYDFYSNEISLILKIFIIYFR